MRRRKFIEGTLAAGLFSAAGISCVTALGEEKVPSKDSPAVISIQGGSPDKMFDRGIEDLGGMAAFIKKGSRVLVKPNIAYDRLPDSAANTNPLLVRRVIEHCYMAGAKVVNVVDHTCNTWTKCYKNSGIERITKISRGKMIPGNHPGHYVKIFSDTTNVLKEVMVHELILGSDILINIPVMKAHPLTRVSLGIKNLMGIVWDRSFYHVNGLDQCLAEFLNFRKPDLTIIDGYNVVVKNGPAGNTPEDVINMRRLIISSDVVAADAVAARFLYTGSAEVEHIRLAGSMGLGVAHPDRISIRNISL